MEPAIVHVLHAVQLFPVEFLLSTRCFLGIIVHEIMHAIGFFHEQSRTDRDRYIRVQFENIQPDSRDQFEKLSQRLITDLNTPYDYGSIMHYDTKYELLFLHFHCHVRRRSSIS